MPRAALPPHDVADLSLAEAGAARIEWAAGQMPVLERIRARFERERPLEGIRIAACLHVTAETGGLMSALGAGGAELTLCSANPLSVQDDVAAGLVQVHGLSVRAARGESLEAYAEHVRAALAGAPQVKLGDG